MKKETNTIQQAAFAQSAKCMWSALLLLFVMLVPQGAWATNGTMSTTTIDGKTFYQICDRADLDAFCTSVTKNSNLSINGILMADIDCNNTALTNARIGDGSHHYKGIFDGNNKTIKNFYIPTNGWERALFGYTEGATIKNLTVTGNLTATGNGTGHQGSVVGKAAGGSVIENVTSSVNINIEYTGYYYVGGIVGECENSTIRNCAYTGTIKITKGTYGIGGIAGDFISGGQITGCTFSGTILLQGGDSKQVGGIVGYAKAGTISDCGSTGTIQSTSTGTCSYVGGIVGQTEGTIEVSQCWGTGTVNAGNGYDCIGGIVGFCVYQTKLKITSCCFTGTLKSDNTSTNLIMGGILGAVNDDKGSYFQGVSNCFAAPTLTYSGSSSNIGGIAGIIKNKAVTKVTDNYYDSDKASRASNTLNGTLGTNYGRTTAQCKSGQVCYELNGSTSGGTTWRQNITSGTVDNYPVLDQAHGKVYNTKHYNCSGTLLQSYTNSSTNYTDAHDYTNQTVSDTYKKSDATCEAAAVYYYNCSKCNANENNANHTFTNGSAIGHGSTGYTEAYSWSGACYNDASKDTKACSFTLKCNKCSTNVVNGSSLACSKTAHTDATCLAAGKTTYSATGSYTSTNSSYDYSATKTHDYTIAAPGHNIVNGSCSRCATEQSYLCPTYKTANTPKDGIASWTTAKHLATPVSSSSSTVTWVSGWYYVPANTTVKLDDGAVCSGDVHLILCDGATLTIAKKAASNSNSNMPGVKVNNGNSLTIYGQANNSGTLSASGVSYTAGIGSQQSGTSGSITINGGTVSASGGTQAAGIGGSSAGTGQNITINGGNVSVTGGDNAAGIGGSTSGIGQNITINGGKVTATGGMSGAGIGGGSQGKGTSIYINGGEITVKSGTNKGAAIGGGGSSSGSGSIYANKSIDIYKGTSLVNNTGQDLTSALKNPYTASALTVTMKPHAFDRMTKSAKYEMTTGTCKVKAVYYYNCSNCGISEANPNHVEEGDLNPNNHKAVDAYDNLKTAATCTADAIYYQTCEWCNAQLTTTCIQANTALGHSLDHHDALAETCTTDGNMEYWQCSRCSGYFKDAEGKESYAKKPTIAKHHTFTNYVYNNDVSCVKDGTMTASCDFGCEGVKDTKKDPEHLAPGHAFAEQVDAKCKKSNATCLQPATYYKSCSVCGAKGTETFTVGTVLTHADGDVCPVCKHGFIAAEGKGTVDEPYLIGNAGQLYWFANQANTVDLGIHGKLIDDITVNDGTFDENGTFKKTGEMVESTPVSWTPIGSGTKEYSGSFDGDNHTVSGLYCDINRKKYIGMFGSVVSSTIKDLGVINSYFNGYYCVGSLCGYGWGNIENCYSSGIVRGTDNIYVSESVGGLCGRNEGALTNCHSSCTVISNIKYTGGLCGSNSGTLTGCYATGNVSSKISSTGGLCGYCQGDNNVSIIFCYATGKITSTSGSVGGLCGYLYCREKNIKVKNCYTSADIEASGSAVGGLVGSIVAGSPSSISIEYCYSTSKVGSGEKHGGIFGNMWAGTVANCYTNTSTEIGIGNKYFGNNDDLVVVTNVSAGVPLSAFQSGEIAYLLNGSRNEGTEESPLVWGQVLEADATPTLKGGGVDTYKRTNIKNQWGTLVVPFDVTIDNTKPYEFYSISSVSDNQLTLTKLSGTLSAGTPVLVRMSEAAKDAKTGMYNLTLTAANTILNTSITNPEAVGGLTLTGSYAQEEVANGYIMSNDTFWNASTLKGNDALWKDAEGNAIATDDRHVYCSPFRAYLAGEIAGVEKILLKVVGGKSFTIADVRAVADILLGKSEVSDISLYDIDGQSGLDIADLTFIIKCLNEGDANNATAVTPGSAPAASDANATVGIMGE